MREVTHEEGHRWQGGYEYRTRPEHDRVNSVLTERTEFTQ